MTPTEALMIVVMEAPRFKDHPSGPPWPQRVVINEARNILTSAAWEVMQRECNLLVERNPGGPG